MPSLLLLDYLQRCRAQYSVLNVTPACTTDECIRVNQIDPRHFAKVVMVRIEDELAMVVMPGNYRLIPRRMAKELGVSRVQLAAEKQFRNRFPRCELGAIPPIGHLFGVRAFAVPAFDEYAHIYCKAGSHGELLCMPFNELRRFAHWDSIGHVAAPQLRNPSTRHLQRLIGLAKAGTRISLRAPMAPALPVSS